jgi:hypothetical protein
MGFLAGAMSWWILLALISGHFRDRFDNRAAVRMNRIAVLAIGGFGVITTGLALK